VIASAAKGDMTIMSHNTIRRSSIVIATATNTIADMITNIIEKIISKVSVDQSLDQLESLLNSSRGRKFIPIAQAIEDELSCLLVPIALLIGII